MSLRQLCNFTYATLAEGRDASQMAELDRLLTPPEDQEKAIAKMNRESMAALGLAPLIPVKAAV